MIPEKIRAVVCDLDGTLLPRSRELPDSARDMICRLYAHGVYFGIASGRPLDELVRLVGIWGLEKEIPLFISMNGAELWDGVDKKEYGYFKLKPEWIRQVIEELEPFHLNPYVYFHGKFLCKEADENIYMSGRRAQKEVVIAKDISELYAEENAKIMFRVKKEQMAELEQYLAEHPSPYYKGFKTQATLLEIAHRQVSKAYALERFCEKHGFGLENVLAFGDTSNDNDMLEASGWGVCLRNGSDDTKAVADEVTEKECEEEGFTYYMEKHMMEPLGW